MFWKSVSEVTFLDGKVKFKNSFSVLVRLAEVKILTWKLILCACKIDGSENLDMEINF
jgi:hypothetical protein